MSDAKMLFCICIIAMFCVTGLITSCTISHSNCKQEGMKQGKSAEDIVRICRLP